MYIYAGAKTDAEVRIKGETPTNISVRKFLRHIPSMTKYKIEGIYSYNFTPERIKIYATLGLFRPNKIVEDDLMGRGSQPEMIWVILEERSLNVYKCALYSKIRNVS